MQIITGGEMNTRIGQDYEQSHGIMGPFGEE